MNDAATTEFARDCAKAVETMALLLAHGSVAVVDAKLIEYRAALCRHFAAGFNEFRTDEIEQLADEMIASIRFRRRQIETLAAGTA